MLYQELWQAFKQRRVDGIYAVTRLLCEVWEQSNNLGDSWNCPYRVVVGARGWGNNDNFKSYRKDIGQRTGLV